LIESSSGKSKGKERGSEKRKENSEEKMRRRLSQDQPCVSHLSAACSSSSSRRRPHNTRVMRYFKEFKSQRFKSSTLIHFKWGSVPVRLMLWRKRRRPIASLWMTRSSKLIGFWMRSGHPSFLMKHQKTNQGRNPCGSLQEEGLRVGIDASSIS
jgi:hypothetical protein